MKSAQLFSVIFGLSMLFAAWVFAEDMDPESDAPASVAIDTPAGLLLSQDEEEFGSELWLQNAQQEQILLRDIVPGPQGSYPDLIAAINGSVLFTAHSEQHGRELWISDGSHQGTTMMADIYPGGADSNPRHFIRWNGGFYFLADNGEFSDSVWFTDGTPQGTQFAAPNPELSEVAAYFMQAPPDMVDHDVLVYPEQAAVEVAYQPELYVFTRFDLERCIVRPFFLFGIGHVRHVHYDRETVGHRHRRHVYRSHRSGRVRSHRVLKRRGRHDAPVITRRHRVRDAGVEHHGGLVSHVIKKRRTNDQPPARVIRRPRRSESVHRHPRQVRHYRRGHRSEQTHHRKPASKPRSSDRNNHRARSSNHNRGHGSGPRKRSHGSGPRKDSHVVRHTNNSRSRSSHKSNRRHKREDD